MSVARAIVIMPYVSGRPEDVAINVLHFDFGPGALTESVADTIKLHVNELFNTAPPNGASGLTAVAVSAYLSNALTRVADACSIKVYDMGTPEPRIPITRTWTLLASNSTTSNEMPAEVALAVSFYGGQNVPRKRGRIYFGPFHISTTTDDATTQRALPGIIVRESLGGAVKRLIQKPANPVNLTVFSRGLYTVNGVKQTPVPGTSYIATAGWVDDAWDTQRRRGQKATTRYKF
jgi:hypothetical protein